MEIKSFYEPESGTWTHLLADSRDKVAAVIDGSQFDRLLEEGDVIKLGQLDVLVMETPGHTGDSISYLARDAAFELKGSD